MSKEGLFNQIRLCSRIIDEAVEADLVKMNNPRKRKDGSGSWSAAAYHFSNILGEQISGEELKNLYYDNI